MKIFNKLFLALTISGLIATAGYANMVKDGEKIFNTKKLGNCLACHDVNGKKINNPGNLGPKLAYLSAWPEQALYDKIYNPNTLQPVTAMPAFGKNGWLNDKQIKALVAYLKTIN
ncbi:Sulfur oxidation protein SoxX [hydrothermal vent metagenome]|uniref:Sulfur oxidation protein SoxX n=1 Tax=hydrothermal vent metagenome TaxID=652676 RepID=A0A3B1E6E3_9ZZZZ